MHCQCEAVAESLAEMLMICFGENVLSAVKNVMLLINVVVTSDVAVGGGGVDIVVVTSVVNQCCCS